MELIPKVLVAGLFTPPPGVPGGPQVTVDSLNRVWSEIAPMYGYRQYVLAPDGSGTQMTGASDDDAVIIQPPLLQIRDPISFNPAKSAEKAQSILRVIARHLGVGQFFNFAVRHVYHVPAPDRDGRTFVMTRLLGKTLDDIADLAGGGSAWIGMKMVVKHETSQYTLVIEPLQRDEQFVFIDLDVQFPGPLDLDQVTARAGEAEGYLRQAVSGYLDKH